MRDSKFKETGRLTPEEFVAAGDFLTYKFPTWQWEAGEVGKRREFLPADKQYLVSRNGESPSVQLSTKRIIVQERQNDNEAVKLYNLNVARC